MEKARQPQTRNGEPEAQGGPQQRSGQAVNRYLLVPRSPAGGLPTGPVRRRYSLARLGVSPRSALGEDRHERLERAADSARRSA
ncbi:MAG: hypothetical protein ACR2GL_00195 [Thermoleophilaceae bacterium]